MLSAQLLAAAVVPVFPLHAVIDCGPLALRTGTAYRFTIALESATGEKARNDIGIGAAATLTDVAEAVSLSFTGVTMRRDGVLVDLTEIDGSPVRKVTFEFKDGGPKPIVRWLPKSQK